MPEDKPPGCQPSRSCSLPRPQHTERDAAPQSRCNLRLPASLPTGVGPVRTQRPHPLHQASPNPVLLALHKQLPGLDGSPRPVEPRGECSKASARGVCGSGGGGDGARGLVCCGGARECMQGCPGKSLARECREGVQVPETDSRVQEAVARMPQKVVSSPQTMPKGKCMHFQIQATHCAFSKGQHFRCHGRSVESTASARPSAASGISYA